MDAFHVLLWILWGQNRSSSPYEAGWALSLGYLPHSFIHSFTNYLFSAYCVPGTSAALGMQPWTSMTVCFHGVSGLVGETGIKQSYSKSQYGS